MADFAALALAGEVPVLHGPQAEDFALVAEALLAAGRLVPFDADETVIAPDDIWSRPGSGLASQVSQAAALASEGHVHLVQLRGIERSAARSWHPALAALARRGLIPRRLLLFATLLDQDASEAASLPRHLPPRGRGRRGAGVRPAGPAPTRFRLPRGTLGSG
ncbi:hypothetical protein QP166_05060 [Sphingomonas sp. LR60]|uniref:hypothetical protein n=1 Tax=Sphingomonas sp. LR60 TaxID=3050233 RepID=UPI002FE3FAFF